MDSGLESSTSASKRDTDKASKKELEKDDDHGSGKGIRGTNKEEETDKGKEKELEKEKDRHRDRDRDRTGDDDNDGEGNSSLHQNLASASSALHGLLRKLGAGLDDLLPSSTPHPSSKLKRILSGLRAEGEDGRQLEALSQLCELLSIGTEESLSSFSVDSFVPVLVGLLNHEYNPDMMLLAARALTHLCDVLPSSCAAVVHYGAVPCLCARLLTIEYIDLAEQSLQALEKISHEHPTACLRAGALMAVLSYLDFFSTGVQRVAVSTAANICRQLPLDASDFVMEAVPILTNLLQYQDAKVVEHASVCLTRIAECFASSPEKIDMLCSHGLIPQAVRLISVSTSSGGMVSQTSLSNSTYTGLIRLLSTCASGSAVGAESLLLLNISGILKDILAGSGLVSSISVSPSAVNRPPEQLYELVTLVNELLPPMPQSAVPPNGVILSRSATRRQSSSSGKADDGSNVVDFAIREKLLRDRPNLLIQFGTDLFPVLVQVYGSSVNPPVRHKCLAAISKLVHFSTADMLRCLFKELNISSFLAGVLAFKDPSILLSALQIAEMLMQKLPDVFTKLFVKEGVVHAIDNLIAFDQVNSSSHQIPSAGRPGDASGGALVGIPPARPRRGARRRSGGSNNETVPEDLKASSSIPVGSPPSNSVVDASLQSSKSGLRSLAIAAAKHFKESYFHADLSIADAGVTESLSKLKALCSKLSGDSMPENKGKWKGKGKAGGTSSTNDEVMLTAIAETLAELGRGDGVSTFEFVGCGVVGSLLNYFSCGNQSRENLSDARLQQQALKRLKQFIAVAIPPDEKGSEAPLTVLVRKLQSALASLERFPVILSHAPRSGTSNASIAAGLSALAQPFKLRLCRAPGERTLRDYSSNIVLIDPLATLSSIEEFLWPRVQRSDVSQKSSAAINPSEGGVIPSIAPATSPSTSAPAALERRPSTRSRSSVAVASEAPTGANKDFDSGTNASSSKGKGKIGARSPAEEHKGPETRNAAARRRAAAAIAPTSKQSQGDSGAPVGSEDEDVEVSPVELDDAVAMDEDDLSEEEDDEEHEEVFGEEPTPVCVGERVHDVRLGDSADVGNGASTSATTGESPSQPSGFSSGVAGIHLGNRAAILTGGHEANELRQGASPGSKNSLSFAAAAMAGLASASGKGLRAGRDRRSLAPLGSSPNVPARLAFSLGCKPLNRSLTIFQAIQRQAIADEDDEERFTGPDYSLGEGRRLWDEIYTISYQRAECSTEKVCMGASSSSSSPKSTTPVQNKAATIGTSSSGTKSSWQQASLLDCVLQGELPCDLDKSNPTYTILLLLRVLDGLNHLAPRLHAQIASDAFAEGRIGNLSEMRVSGPLVPQEEFLSSKLTPKLARQMQDALALCSGGLPAWCYQLTRACPFLFPFETRRQYFYSTAFGLSRALQRLQQQQNADNPTASNDRELRIGRLQRQKVRISRNRILDSAAKVMELYAGHKAVLEVEYFGEVGTGLGPTLEFYTLLSHDMQKASLDMWRTGTITGKIDDGNLGDVDMQDADSENPEENTSVTREGEASERPSLEHGDYVQAPYGLFPRPWPPNLESSSDSKFTKVVERFRLLGRAMAKALQDSRLLDLPLSNAFYKLMLGQELDLYDLKSFDKELGETLEEMQNLVLRQQFLESSTGDNRQALQALRFQDAKVEDLCLDFTLPGYPEYLLKSGGQNIEVNLENLEEYISLVVDATVKTGIAPHMEAFRAGFNQVLQISSLQIFNEEELDYLLCGRREVWVPETLAEHLKFDHGYTATSLPIRNLLEIMGEFNAEEQRAFLRFVTGAPRLPSGGLAALSPKLTIVRKHPTGMSGAAAVLSSTPPGASALGTTLADGDLPSVMTCANYLKLPPYSCEEVMRERLVYAIREGQGSFDLS